MNEIITYSPELQSFFDMWHLATYSNDVNAQFNLAKCFLKSRQKNTIKKAFALFKKLAHQSYTQIQTNAQFMLGKCYEHGYGITKSYPRAIRWYEIAERNISNDLINNPDPVGEAASKSLDKAIEGRNIDEALDDIFYEHITPELIDCITEAAESGDVDSQEYLMDLYALGGSGIESDDEESAYWAKKAAKNGNAKAMYKLGHMYYYGSGMKYDCKKALYWLEKSAAQGEESSAYQLGKHYKSQNQYKEAAKWYREYAEIRIKWRNNRLGWKTATYEP